MTRAESIKRLEIIATNLCGQSAQNPNLWPDYKAVDIAISALRQQEHFRDLKKKVETLTNAQKIRAMTDEELAKLLCFTGWRMFEQKECLEWLQRPAREGDKHESN